MRINWIRRCAASAAVALATLFFVFAGATLAPASAETLAGINTCGSDVNTPPSTINPVTDGTRIREAVRCLINAERAAFGLQPLSESGKLALAADGHAKEAARLKWWTGYPADSHVHPETHTTIAGRIVAAGYCSGNPTQMAEITYSGTGNDASGVGCPLIACSTPAAAVNWWVNISTSGHRLRVLDPAVREMGVGFSGEGANKNVPPQPQMGSYVVDFGDCPVIEVPPPPPVSPPPSQPGTIVRFNHMHVNDCPEVGICDWKLTCKLGDQSGVELLRMVEANTGENENIDRTLIQRSGFPVTVTCAVMERDGPFLFFDDPVWEHVGTIAKTFAASGDGDIRINQNSDEGDVTINLFVEPLGAISTGSTATGQLPPAPRNCRLPVAEEPGCGYIDIECDPPLPYMEIGVRSEGVDYAIEAYRVVHEFGQINAKYRYNEGDAILSVCARNSAGWSCSNRFAVTFGPSLCVYPPVLPGPCPSGQMVCMTDGVCRPFAQCDYLQ